MSVMCLSSMCEADWLLSSSDSSSSSSVSSLEAALAFMLGVFLCALGWELHHQCHHHGLHHLMARPHHSPPAYVAPFAGLPSYGWLECSSMPLTCVPVFCMAQRWTMHSEDSFVVKKWLCVYVRPTCERWCPADSQSTAQWEGTKLPGSIPRPLLCTTTSCSCYLTFWWPRKLYWRQCTHIRWNDIVETSPWYNNNWSGAVLYYIVPPGCLCNQFTLTFRSNGWDLSELWEF